METRSWQEVLADLCTDQQKKQDIAERVGSVTVRTLERWLDGVHRPQKDETIRKLAEISDELRDALEREFPEAFHLTRALVERTERGGIPSEFYNRALLAYAYVPRASRQWSIFRLVAHQVLQHLDPNRNGLILLYCHPQNPNLVEEGMGNASWSFIQVQEDSRWTTPDPDSWLAQTARTARPAFIQSCAAADCPPPPQLVRADLIASMAFLPLYRSGIYGGGIFVFSTEEHFFTPSRQALLEAYSCLFALMLSGSRFSA